MRTLVFLFLLLLIPQITVAQGLIPCGGPDCTTCDLFVLVNNIYLFLLKWSPVVAFLAIGYAGVQMILFSSNSGKVNQARGLIWKTLQRLAIIYCSFLIVNLVIHLVVGGSGLEGTWYKFSCKRTPTNIGGIATPGSVGLSASSRGGVSMGPPPSNVGTFTPPSGGYCSENYLKSALGVTDSTKLKIFSCICTHESGGRDPGIPNSTHPNAICNNRGNPKPVVWGLMQLDLPTKVINGVDCTQAFGGPSNMLTSTSGWQQCYIKNEALYNQCVRLASDPATNLKFGYQLSRNGTWWQDWTTAHWTMQEYSGKGACAQTIYELTGKRWHWRNGPF